MYDYTTYLSEISEYKQLKLEEVERSLLFRVINTYESSAYKIASHIRIKRLSSQYKSEFPVMKRLQYYKLTTFGLFYIFSNTLNYPPQLLVYHQDSSILKALLFQYLQPNTIRQCTGRFYATITQYLKDCCRVTINGLNKSKLLGNIEQGLVQ